MFFSPFQIIFHLIVFFLFCILLRQDDNSSQSKKKGRSKEGNVICFSISLSQKRRQISRQNAKKNQKNQMLFIYAQKIEKGGFPHLYFFLVSCFILFYYCLFISFVESFFFLKISASLAPFPIWQAWSRKTKQNQNKIKPKILKQSFVQTYTYSRVNPPLPPLFLFFFYISFLSFTIIIFISWASWST